MCIYDFENMFLFPSEKYLRLGFLYGMVSLCSTLKGISQLFPQWLLFFLDFHQKSMSILIGSSVQFSSVTQSCPTLCDPMNCSMLGFPVHHQLSESTQTHVYWVSDAIQPSHPLSSPSSPALNLSQHQGLFQWVSSLHQVARVLQFQLQHQNFQWTPRTDL